MGIYSKRIIVLPFVSINWIDFEYFHEFPKGKLITEHVRFCSLERYIVVLIRTRIRQFVCVRHNEFDSKIIERSSLKQSIVSFEWIIWLFK
jgi:hypothetical protein